MWPRGPGGEQKPALLLTPGWTHHKPTRRRFTTHPLNATQGRVGRARAGEHRSCFPSSEGRTLCHTPREVLPHGRNQSRQGRRWCTREPAQQVQGVLVSVSKGLRESTARGAPEWSRVTDSSWLRDQALLVFFTASRRVLDVQTATGLQDPRGHFPGAVPACLRGRRRMASPASESAADPREAWPALPTAGMGAEGAVLAGGCPRKGVGPRLGR